MVILLTCVVQHGQLYTTRTNKFVYNFDLCVYLV